MFSGAWEPEEADQIAADIEGEDASVPPVKTVSYSFGSAEEHDEQDGFLGKAALVDESFDEKDFLPEDVYNYEDEAGHGHDVSERSPLPEDVKEVFGDLEELEAERKEFAYQAKVYDGGHVEAVKKSATTSLDYPPLSPVATERQISVKRDTPTRISPRPFEPAKVFMKEIRGDTPKVQNLKSRFEGSPTDEGNRQPGHPPEIHIDFGGYKEEKFRKSPPVEEEEEEEEAEKEKVIAYEVEHEAEPPPDYDEPVSEAKIEERVRFEEPEASMQKEPAASVQTILSIFGGKATPQEKHESVYRVRYATPPSPTVSTPTQTEHVETVVAEPEHVQVEPKEPRRIKDDQRFMSLRVVKNVRDYVQQQVEIERQREREKLEAQLSLKRAAARAEALRRGPQKVDSAVQADEFVVTLPSPPLASAPALESPSHDVEYVKEVKETTTEQPIDSVETRRKLFENLDSQNRAAPRRSSSRKNPPLSPQASPVEQQIPAPRFVDVGVGTFATPEEIQMATEEIASTIAHLKSVPERRMAYERNARRC